MYLFIIPEQGKSIRNYLLTYVLIQEKFKVVYKNKITTEKLTFKTEAKEDRGNNSRQKWDDDKLDRFSKPNIRNNYSNLEIQ